MKKNVSTQLDTKVKGKRTKVDDNLVESYLYEGTDKKETVLKQDPKLRRKKK